jgi:hypothetical protein
MQKNIFCIVLLFAHTVALTTQKHPLADPVILGQLAVVTAGTAISLVHLMKIKYPQIPSIEEFLAYKLFGIKYSKELNTHRDESFEAEEVLSENQSVFTTALQKFKK